MKVYWYYSSFK